MMKGWEEQVMGYVSHYITHIIWDGYKVVAFRKVTFVEPVPGNPSHANINENEKCDTGVFNLGSIPIALDSEDDTQYDNFDGSENIDNATRDIGKNDENDSDEE